MSFDNLLLKLDETLTHVLGQWDWVTTSILGGIILFFGYQVFSRRDPDIHPMLLARQSQASAVRQPGESSIYRAHAAPHGLELNYGLNVRDPGVSKWARGRAGDLRDVWRKVVTGPVDQEGNPTNQQSGRILTVFGTEQVTKHKTDDISKNINIIGKYFQQQKASRIAIYLPNSIELLVAIFAASFYGLTPIILPYDQPAETIISQLKTSKADSLIAAVGSIPFDTITKGYPALRHLVWVVDEGSKHLDWNEVPKGTGGKVNVSTWQEIIEDHKDTSSELPPLEKDQPKNLIAFWQKNAGEPGELVEYTHLNLVSGISAQISAIPAAQRINPSDLFYSADSLSTVYPLVLTLAALYSNASVALNSVAGHSTDLSVATEGIAPTIIVASSSTLSKVHKETADKVRYGFLSFVHYFQTRTLTQEGVLPLASSITKFNDTKRPAIGTTPGKLRLVFVSERAGSDAPPLTSTELSDLRIFTGARVIYALTTAKVAGAVAQTGFYDYRITDETEGKHSHFGAPVTSVEVFLRDYKEHKTTDEKSVGEIVARGPAVVGGEAALGIVGEIRDDNTIGYL